MEISKENFFSNAKKLGLADEQIILLWNSLKNDISSPEPSAISKWLFYFGAMIVISAMTWFMSIGWELFGGGGIFLISLAYTLTFIAMGKKLWDTPFMRIPAGLFITIAVCMTPLTIYGLEKYFEIWPLDYYQNYFIFVQGNWMLIEMATILVGSLAISFFPFPFLTAPIFLSAWFLAMNIPPLITGKESSWENNQWISLFFGMGLIVISYIIHLNKKKAYAFWGYLFGLLAFWISLTDLTWFNSEGFFFLYLVINIGLMFISLLLKSRIFMVFGAIGSFIYFSHLAYQVFENSIFFPFIFSFIGLAIIYLGILYQKNSHLIDRKVNEKIPLRLQKLLPSEEEKED